MLFRSYVIDNEVMGMARRCLEGIDTSEEALAVESIKRVGPHGNYLVDDLTLQRLRSEPYAPTLSNRDSRAQWEASGKPDIAVVARANALHIIRTSQAPGLEQNVDRKIRRDLDIRS